MSAREAVLQLLCPKCALHMHVWESNGLTLDHCHNCKGLWFDAGELSRHLARSGADLDETELELAEATSLPCPRCPGMRLAHARESGVTLDVCPRCRGIFLDVGEVHELLGAIRRSDFAGDPAVAHLGNLALGLYIAARLGEKGAKRRRDAH
ncbi:MAG TPA: zf-TFIIB domain-containing protein [Myxococcota bacterium]|nr:zf-TFIIB domain-containing protein [Myxococcota bacterium]